MTSKEKLFLLTIILITIFLYVPIFKYGFSQDDFIHLFSSRATNFYQVLNFFNPFAHFPDIFFYRPLTTQFYFFINNSLFGLNPLIYHLEALLLHLLNTYLFFILVRKVWQDKKIALISCLLYGTSAIHFLSLFYISSFQQIGQMFFIFLTIILFLNYQEKQNKKYLIFLVLTFILSLLSKETSIILPGLIFILEIIRKPNQNYIELKKLLLKLSPFLLMITLYLLVRLLGFQSIFSQGSYQLEFTVKNFSQNLKWYILWIFGLPEIITTYPSISISSIKQFTKDSNETIFILSSYLLTVSISIFATLSNLSKHKKLLILNLIFFLTSLLPVLFLKDHKYPQYLDKAFIVLLPTIAFSIIGLKKISRLYLTIFIISYMILQFLSLR